MARKSQDLKRIEARREEIAARMSELETELEKLRSEEFDLAVAERVLTRLSTSHAMGTVAEPEEAKEFDVEAAEAIDRTMTIGDMALVVLNEVGNVGLTSNEILASIRERWLPALLRSSLSPPLSRLKSKGQIWLDGDRWKAAAKNGAASSAAPETDGDRR